MKLIELPNQEAVCAQEGVLCGLAEVEERRSFGRSSWDKQMIVLQPTGCLLIYKYYLLGKGKGTPEIGRIVHLNELHRMSITMKRITLIVELTGTNKKVTRLRFEGELVPIWGAKLFLYKISLPGLMHSMHSDQYMPLGFFVDKERRDHLLGKDAGKDKKKKDGMGMEKMKKSTEESSKEGMNNSSTMFEAKLANAVLLKKIFDVVNKDVVSDAPFACSARSMSFQSMDSSRVALVSLRMERGLFSTYRCDSNAEWTLPLSSLTTALHFSSSQDSVSIKYEGGDYATLEFRDHEQEKRQEVRVKVKETDAENVGISTQEYSLTVQMGADELQKTLRDLGTLGDAVNITANKAGVTFSAKGDTASARVHYAHTGEGGDQRYPVTVKCKEDVNENFSLKYLNKFARAASISDTVTLSLSNDTPLRMEYSIEDNGYLRFYLSSRIDDEDM